MSEAEGIVTRDIIATPAAPAAIGPYSQAVRAGNVVYTSGQIPLDPATGELVAGDIVRQTEQVLNNIKAVLAASGSSFERTIKLTCYLTDLSCFAQVNEVFNGMLREPFPARSCVEVSALPRGALVEIEAIALTG